MSTSATPATPATPAAPVRPRPSQLLLDTKVVAVLRATHAAEYEPVIEALLKGGVRSIELTLSTAGVFEHLPALRARFGAEAEIGVGTVTNVGQALEAIEAGASYLVTPVTGTDIIETSVSRGVPIFPGGLTPTELHSGWAAGGTAVKVFPASLVGESYIAMLRGPFPGIQVIPSGGVGLDDAVRWIGAGALAVSVGGPLLGDAFAGGDLGALTDRATRLAAAVAEAAA
ncbi:2-dehydro-3-deoxyphosphogluconate aldolase [Subtercola sp. Z020]|uniref:bifunctional 4-hydroxy-2-oxoglutarate aldolase/2-dehydro-3-deoxy-phosphogluconate aldolase n=1 Tax=Subtercola sp. Z020 TaxID=2080582 RepID=UPI000CE92773|nr:bifunctional 4-hydroxy-2-oxoglutarate aldolase/2-dehydro-3-deoxy-phosphogluconate aldolase [Subtercola sp. Z020]PPF85617.1 2-dehydro-3-deoxyphosphogluconate aldolase [Subtercola sp. Z020]